LALLPLPATGRAATAQYTIRPHGRAAEVRAWFPQNAEESVAFALQSWAGYDYFRDIECVAASDLRGHPLPVEPQPEGEWLARNHRLPFQLTWRAKATKDAHSQIRLRILRWGRRCRLPAAERSSPRPAARDAGKGRRHRPMPLK
jgi:hypothetical protein